MRQNKFGIAAWFCAAVVLSSAGSAAARPRALVYKGPGACDELCSESAAEIARSAGFETHFVGPDSGSSSVFADASIWIQPGGVAATAAEAMSPKLKRNLRNFIARGGGYVGFCAGGFLATAEVGTSGVRGLGILPGWTSLRDGDQSAAILSINWDGNQRSIYWEGGPYFDFPNDSDVEVIARYPDGEPAAVRSGFGRGRVFVTGLHPEAPRKWLDYYKLKDADGPDADLVREMMAWVTEP